MQLEGDFVAFVAVDPRGAAVVGAFQAEDGDEAAQGGAVVFEVELVGALLVFAPRVEPGMEVLIGGFAPNGLECGFDARIKAFADTAAQAVAAVGIDFFAAVFAQEIVAAKEHPIFRQNVHAGGKQQRLRAVEMFVAAAVAVVFVLYLHAQRGFVGKGAVVGRADARIAVLHFSADPVVLDLRADFKRCVFVLEAVCRTEADAVFGVFAVFGVDFAQRVAGKPDAVVAFEREAAAGGGFVCPHAAA